jgi:hypothetical protein
MEQAIDRIYMVQAGGFGNDNEWENVAAFSTEEGAEAYETMLRGKCADDYEPLLRTVSEAFNPVFPYTQ